MDQKPVLLQRIFAAVLVFIVTFFVVFEIYGAFSKPAYHECTAVYANGKRVPAGCWTPPPQ